MTNKVLILKKIPVSLSVLRHHEHIAFPFCRNCNLDQEDKECTYEDKELNWKIHKEPNYIGTINLIMWISINLEILYTEVSNRKY